MKTYCKMADSFYFLRRWTAVRIHEECLPCIVNQAVKVSKMTNAGDRDILYKKIFNCLSKIDFESTTPEVIGETFDLVKKHIGNADPYLELRRHYNKMFLELSQNFQAKINQSKNPFQMAVKYAILGNIIDFNPIHNSELSDILVFFDKADEMEFTWNDVEKLRKKLSEAKTLLYLGDNCGEICLDKLFLELIKKMNPKLQIYFGVRGFPVVNDSIATDAYEIGMDEVAEIIDNGDKALGTVLEHTSDEFQKVFGDADVVIAKGQANYECLSERQDKDIYFLLMTKCKLIAEDIGVPEKSMICMGKEKEHEK